MGWIKDAKAAGMGAEAGRAWEKGRGIFFCRINFPSSASHLSGEVEDFAVQIEAVEAAGWWLDKMSMGQDAKGRPEGYFLFRRGQQPVVSQQIAPSRTW